MAAPSSMDAAQVCSGFLSRKEVSFLQLPNNDEELRKFLAGSSTDLLVPDPSNRLNWCDNVSYSRILTVCDPEQARVLLCWMTDGKMLRHPAGALHSCKALAVMNQPKLISKFIRVVQASRTGCFNTIHASDLLDHNQDSDYRNPFYNGLPENIRRVLEIENPLHKFDPEYGLGREKLTRCEARDARNLLLARIDEEMGDFAKSLQPQERQGPEKQPAQLDQSVATLDLRMKNTHLGEIGKKEEGKKG